MSDWVTPDPIPNSAVKPVSADDSRKAKVGRRQNHDVFFICKIFSAEPARHRKLELAQALRAGDSRKV